MNIEIREKDLYNIIINSIENKDAFYHIRPGDAEMIVLNFLNLEEKIVRRPLIKQLGYRIENEYLTKIKENLENSIINANIIGLPESFHKKHNEYWKSSNKIIREILESNNIDINSKKFCSIDSHLHLLESGRLDKIIKSTDNIVLITCRNIQKEFLEKYKNIKNIEVLLIPPQQKYEINPGKSIFFPEVYEKIKKEITSKDRKGQLCLFGTGFSGKDLGLYFKKMGGDCYRYR